jgi:HPt (histidine-containing phosphotransfer) domain-containing protein
MDGFETARAIRELEKSNRLARRGAWSQTQPASGSPPCLHLPIVGMTAHGHIERKESRWEHVMDDCLAKPVHLQDLANVIEQWVGFNAQAGDDQVSSSDARLQGNVGGNSTVGPLERVSVPVNQQKACDIYDYSAALESIDGEEILLHSLFQIFLDTGPNLIQGMRDAIASEDRQRFQRHAHQLKGALCALNARQQAIVTERLEAEASVALFSELQTMFEAMEHEVEALMTLFRDTLLVRIKK